MAIVQISKIQQRAGNLVDLPQLDNAEFGWATDENRLFIGRTGNTYADENIEVLTSYSNISFSQIQGSNGGNFNIVAAQNGQILTYVSSTDTWENYTGANSQLGGNKLQLGDVSNISMLGGAIAYILQTDGLGNLSWTPKGTLYTNIKAVSSANPIVMTVANTTPYVNGTTVTITGVAGTNANSIINGLSFYITLANDYPTSGNVKLYTDISRTTGANGFYLTATANTGIATAIITGGGAGASQAAGSNTTVQFNDQNISNGVAGFTFDKTTTTLTVSTGNIVTGNVSANTSITAPSLVSNIATGTAPLTVTSTTLVPNLFVARANVSEYSNTALTTTGTWYPIFVNATSGNLAQGANANFSFNAATGTLSATLFSGNGSSLSAIAGANVSGAVAYATTANAVAGANVSGTVANANVSIYETVTTQTTGIYYPTFVNANTTGNYQLASNTTISANIANGALIATTFVGNILGNIGGILANGTSNVSIPTVNSNINLTAAGNTTMIVTGTGVNVAGTLNTGSGVITGNGNGLSSLVGANVTGNVGNALNAYAVAGANVTGTVSSATTAGTVTTAAQGNITSVGTLTSLGVNGTVTAVAFTANTGVFTGNGNGLSSIVGANVTGNVGNALNAYAVAGVNVSGTVANATYAVSAGSATTAGTVTTAAQGNITSVGTLSSLTVTANVATGGIKTDNYYYANGVSISFAGAYSNANVAAYLPTFSGTVGATALTTGSNTTVGTITGNWGLSAGSKLTATYADLAEYYEADKPYEPGTVVEFGGDKEVTIAEDGTTRVAGVVSTDPAYVMNSQCQGEYIVALALQGRVPCKVRGTIRKGDMLISAGEGYARPMIHPYTGSVIGKSLENFEGEGIIEVAVGRL